jgi:hypothetical protein
VPKKTQRFKLLRFDLCYLRPLLSKLCLLTYQVWEYRPLLVYYVEADWEAPQMKRGKGDGEKDTT